MSSGVGFLAEEELLGSMNQMAAVTIDERVNVGDNQILQRSNESAFGKSICERDYFGGWGR